MKRDTVTQLSATTIALHWLVAVSIIGLLLVGVYMVETKAYGLYPWHKSFGVIVFLIVLVRVGWRILNGWPEPIRQYPDLERITAKVVHWILILATVLMPVSGFLMSSLGGHGVDLFGVELVARNPDPENPKKVLAHNGDLAGLAHSIHHWVGYILFTAVILHIAGALKHHLMDKDGTLSRMLGRGI